MKFLLRRGRGGSKRWIFAVIYGRPLIERSFILFQIWWLNLTTTQFLECLNTPRRLYFRVKWRLRQILNQSYKQRAHLSFCSDAWLNHESHCFLFIYLYCWTSVFASYNLSSLTTQVLGSVTHKKCLKRPTNVLWSKSGLSTSILPTAKKQ